MKKESSPLAFAAAGTALVGSAGKSTKDVDDMKKHTPRELFSAAKRGDILLSSRGKGDMSKFVVALGTGASKGYHTSIVESKNPDGTLNVLEHGPAVGWRRHVLKPSRKDHMTILRRKDGKDNEKVISNAGKFVDANQRLKDALVARGMSEKEADKIRGKSYSYGRNLKIGFRELLVPDFVSARIKGEKVTQGDKLNIDGIANNIIDAKNKGKRISPELFGGLAGSCTTNLARAGAPIEKSSPTQLAGPNSYLRSGKLKGIGYSSARQGWQDKALDSGLEAAPVLTRAGIGLGAAWAGQKAYKALAGGGGAKSALTKATAIAVPALVAGGITKGFMGKSAPPPPPPMPMVKEAISGAELVQLSAAAKGAKGARMLFGPAAEPALKAVKSVKNMSGVASDAALSGAAAYGAAKGGAALAAHKSVAAANTPFNLAMVHPGLKGKIPGGFIDVGEWLGESLAYGGGAHVAGNVGIMGARGAAEAVAKGSKLGKVPGIKQLGKRWEKDMAYLFKRGLERGITGKPRSQIQRLGERWIGHESYATEHLGHSIGQKLKGLSPQDRKTYVAASLDALAGGKEQIAKIPMLRQAVKGAERFIKDQKALNLVADSKKVSPRGELAREWLERGTSLGLTAAYPKHLLVHYLTSTGRGIGGSGKLGQLFTATEVPAGFSRGARGIGLTTADKAKRLAAKAGVSPYLYDLADMARIAGESLPEATRPLAAQMAGSPYPKKQTATYAKLWAGDVGRHMKDVASRTARGVAGAEPTPQAPASPVVQAATSPRLQKTRFQASSLFAPVGVATAGVAAGAPVGIAAARTKTAAKLDGAVAKSRRDAKKTVKAVPKALSKHIKLTAKPPSPKLKLKVKKSQADMEAVNSKLEALLSTPEGREALEMAAGPKVDAKLTKLLARHQKLAN